MLLLHTPLCSARDHLVVTSRKDVYKEDVNIGHKTVCLSTCLKAPFKRDLQEVEMRFQLSEVL